MLPMIAWRRAAVGSGEKLRGWRRGRICIRMQTMMVFTLYKIIIIVIAKIRMLVVIIE